MDEDQSRNLRDNIDDINTVINALGHESRLMIVSYLLDGDNDLRFLMESTGLSKNGLVNHLSKLMDAGVVERISRGKYSLTRDGGGYIRDIVDQYLISESYRSKRRRVDASMYQWRIQEVKEKIVSNPAEYKPSWFSYQGAVQGVLNSLGVEVGLSEVIAVSGYGWITNAMKTNLCPSAPSAYHSDIWMGNYRASENLGYAIDLILSGSFAWGPDQKPTEEAVKNAKKQYEEVVKEIDADRPVVMWGIPIPEYGIVNGYKGEEYIVSTFRSIVGQPDSPIHFSGLMAPGGLMSMRFVEPKKLDPREVAARTLKRGYKLGVGEVPQLPEYVLGTNAYDVLVKNLTEESFDENSHHGTAYTFACLMESKEAVSEYLKKVDDLFDVDLGSIAEKYDALHKVLQKCHELFPMGPGEMGEEKCDKAAELLKDAKKYEVEALEDLKEALDAI